MQPPDPETIARWHRWFAVECNNRAWDLAAQATRTPEEDRELLAAAYAAAFHWSKVGQPINAMRAETLLAHAHALTGRGAEALVHARRCLAFCDERPADCEPWDVAFAHLEMALAASAAGEGYLHARHSARARELGEALEDREERDYFLQELGRIPMSAGTG